ncbi:type II secretion system F family protein [Pseudoduganella sp. GCM10020061]|uniref:type II secretion system F family protein n=1 Tax=Pseudoduganella sp. GCM10020061 TaxID=3317345 RepID=UPI00363FA1EA
MFYEKIGGESFLVLSVLACVAVLLMFEGCYLLWKGYRGPEAKKIDRRLQAISAASDMSAQTALLRQKMLSELPLHERLMRALPQMHRIDRLLLQADLRWSSGRLMLTCLGAGALGMFVARGILAQPATVTLGAGALMAALPVAYVLRRRAKRLQRLERQLPDALDLLTRALRAGHAFSAGLQMIGDEMPQPIASEFNFTHDEINFGVSMEQALINLSERVPLTDLRYFVVSVVIQRDSGGNLTEVLSNLSRLIRERLKLMGRVRVLSAEGRMSAWILAVMPFALAGLLQAFNPEFMKPMWSDPIGITILQYLSAMMVLGILLLRKITRIHV